LRSIVMIPRRLRMIFLKQDALLTCPLGGVYWSKSAKLSLLE
jgi:hypothetical protein